MAVSSALLSLSVLCLCRVGLSASVHKRTITPEFGRSGRYGGSLDTALWDLFKPDLLKDPLFDDTFDLEDDSNQLSPIKPQTEPSLEALLTDIKAHPWRDLSNRLGTERLVTADKRDSLHDLLKSLRIQGSYRLKPMRFGAGRK